MLRISRRNFLQSSALLLAATYPGSAFRLNKSIPPLSFSTLGCPDWSFDKIIEFASAHGYQGLELRGILREMNLSKCKEFDSEASRAATLSKMKSANLRFVNLGSSCMLHFSDPAKRKENLDEARSFIDLASQIGCPYIRVFPNNLPKEQDKQVTMDLIASGLKELGEYAKDKKVIVLMETHGEVVHADDLVSIMKMAGHSNTGLVWDICNMWTVTREPVAEVYDKLKKWIHHTHIKDARVVKGEPQYVAELGRGEVPIFEAIDLLVDNHFKGFYSYEWEKLWHPELASPEQALAAYPETMKIHFS